MQTPIAASPQPIFELSHQLWDWAGIDGLQLAQLLFGAAVSKIAPFQSIETTFSGEPCSVLRLCEGNFRLAIASHVSAAPLETNAAELNLWVKPSHLGAIALSESVGIAHLPQIATTKPIYHLETLQPNCAAPARIDGIAVLIWRHSWQHQPIFELHVAQDHLSSIQHKLQHRINLPATSPMAERL
jgi:hypothetical protein